MERKHRTSIDITLGDDAYHIYGVLQEKFNVQQKVEVYKTWYETGSTYKADTWEEVGDGTTEEIIEALKAEYNVYDLAEMKVNALFDQKVLDYCYDQRMKELEGKSA